MTYKELLNRPEWHNKCVQILNRDGHRCKICGCFGFHPASQYECEDISSLKGILRDFYVNNVSLVDFILSEYESSDGYIETNAKIFKVIVFNDGTCETRISRFGRKHPILKSAIAYVRSNELIYEESKISEFINVEYKEYGMWRDDDLKFIDNSITVNFGQHFSNRVESACSFKFEKSFSEKCILSVWNQPCTGAISDQWGTVFLSSTMLSITFKNYCFTIQMTPWEVLNDKDGITGGLNVHHKYYIKNSLPWDYEDDALVTLCDECHKKIHKTINIPVYRNAKIKEAFIGNAELCNRCGGGGYLPQYEHVENGVCFKCWGEGVIIPY